MNGAGIASWGVALCRRRLLNAETQNAWNRPSMQGARAIAGHDEDAITLAAYAAFDALKEVASTRIDGLIFATTTAPFSEKSSATMLASILDLDPRTRILDLNSSLRSGTKALAVARDWIEAGVCRNVLIVAADTRVQKPGASDEILFGHAGVALLVSTEDCLVEIITNVESNSAQPDTWRLALERFPRNADQRFAREGAYKQPVKNVIQALLTATGWKPEEASKVIVYSPDVKSGSGILRESGFDVKTQYIDLASSQLGLTGAPHTLLMMCAAMERSKSDERLCVIGYGDGADGFALRMKEQPKRSPFRIALKQSYEISYNRYLSLHQLYAGAEGTSAGFTSEIMSERNRQLWLNLKAFRCASCGAVITLPIPSCPSCRSEKLENYPLQRNGTVYAITHEHYFPTPEPPLGMATIDLDGGGRLTLQVTDENIPMEIGDRVELVLRRYHDAGNFPNYFWKCRPVEVTKGA